MSKDYRLKWYSTPVLITVEGNVLNISWLNSNSILIKVKSESLIEYQVVKDHGFNIIVESEEKE